MDNEGWTVWGLRRPSHNAWAEQLYYSTVTTPTPIDQEERGILDMFLQMLEDYNTIVEYWEMAHGVDTLQHRRAERLGVPPPQNAIPEAIETLRNIITDWQTEVFQPILEITHGEIFVLRMTELIIDMAMEDFQSMAQSTEFASNLFQMIENVAFEIPMEDDSD